MINIDTDNLKQASTAASSASDSLNDAAGLLLQITQHTDWVCPNRDKINEYIKTNRSLITDLLADAKSFDAAIQSVTDEFVSQESQISNLFEEVEELLANVLNVNTGTAGTISSIGSTWASNAASAVSSISQIAMDALEPQIAIFKEGE